MEPIIKHLRAFRVEEAQGQVKTMCSKVVSIDDTLTFLADNIRICLACDAEMVAWEDEMGDDL